MGKVFLKTPKIKELSYRKKLIENRQEKTDFPESIWETWASKWLVNDKNNFYAYVTRKKDGINVGEVSYYFDKEEQIPFISIFIESLYRRNYYGQEAIKLLLDRCLKKMKFSSVAVKYPKDNEILNKFFIKIGFKPYKEENTYLYAKMNKDDFLISDYIDEEGKIKKLPSTIKVRKRLVDYLATKFIFGQLYSDRAFSKIISDYTNSKDFQFFKQELLSMGYLEESYDKSKYQRIK